MIYIIYYKEDGLKLSESKGRIDTFANRLQKAMDIRGMKKAELARQTGISQQSIGQYAKGQYEAKQSALYDIAEVLDVNIAWLMGYNVPMEPKSCESKTNNPPKKSPKKIANEDLKLALFGDREVNDEVLEDVKDMAKIHLELLKKRRGRRGEGLAS
jgi:transcriptional regulator with XRE-family HTH domain